MPTGYEVGQYRDIGRAAAALERLADVAERIAAALEARVDVEAKAPGEADCCGPPAHPDSKG